MAATDQTEHLITGWEPDLPAGDTLLRATVLATADRVRHAAASSGRPYVADARWVAAFQAERGFLTNVAVLLQPPTDWGWLVPALAEVVPRDRPVAITSAWPTPDLRAEGLELIGHPPLMMRPAGPTEAPPDEMDVVEVSDEAGLAEFERTVVDGFPIRDLQPYRFGCLHGPGVLGGPSHFFVGRVDGQPVATALGHTVHGVNLVEMVATVASHRGRGYGAALTMAAGRADPTAPAVLLASDDGRPVYQRLGFLPIARWTVWQRPR